MSAFIDDLERVNQILDLCIDRGLHEYYDLGGQDSLFSLSDGAVSRLKNLQDKGNNEHDGWKDCFTKTDFPVLEIKIPVRLSERHPHLIATGSIMFQRGEKPYKPLGKIWSDLFWAKRLRAELLKYNKKPWLDQFDNLLHLLETCMPDLSLRRECLDTEWARTLFAYLMELSAAAQGEASHGYAERARKLINSTYKSTDAEVKDNLDHPRHGYDRWIWYNKGLAYQHIGRNKEAVLEFNQVIATFRKKLRWDQDPGVHDTLSYNTLEFLLNVYPSVLQRAAINIKLQLGYHALQTLADLEARKLLELCERESDILKKAALELRNRTDLFEVEALLQMEREADAKSRLDDLYRDRDIFVDYDEAPHSSLPSPQDYPKAVQTQLVEQTVSWYLQCDEGPRGLYDILLTSRKPDSGLGNDTIGNLDGQGADLSRKALSNARIVDALSRAYWEWVRDNPFDERIYFSNWGQLLGLLAKILGRLRESIESARSKSRSSKAEELTGLIRVLLDSALKLYCSRADDRPRTEHQMMQFRSDDLPDYCGGLSRFYEETSKFFLKDGDQLALEAKKAFEGACRTMNVQNAFFQEACHAKDPVLLLRSDHLELLEALDKYEKEVGENQRISSLRRCNERLIWLFPSRGDKGERCIFCFSGTKGLQSGFKGLLQCVDDAGGSVDEERAFQTKLDRYDYECIMREAEERLTKQLRSPTQPEPRKHALRFSGLQRWNSLTPAQGRSVGGGYFIYRTGENNVVDLGIVIDPGFDFIRNFFRMGFSLRDIDIVLISHAHPDHVWDFESMVHLLHELDAKSESFHRVNVLLTFGIYKKFQDIIGNPVLRRFIDPIVIDSRKEIDERFFENLNRNGSLAYIERCVRFEKTHGEEKRSAVTGFGNMRWRSVLPSLNEDNTEREESDVIEIWPTRAYHDDYSEVSDSYGFIIKFDGPRPLSFGYTGDTKWVGDDLYNAGCPVQELGKPWPCKETCRMASSRDADGKSRWSDIASQYADCDVLLVHLGSLIEHKKNRWFEHYNDRSKCEEMIRNVNHPYLMGLIRFLGKIRSSERVQHSPKLVLISEFGEELRGGIRKDIVDRLREGIIGGWPVLPVDVGLDILLRDYDSQGNEARGFSFLCVLCDDYHDVKKVDYVRFGQDEAIFHVCQTCKKAKSPDVQHTRLQQLYEIGRELRPVPDERL